MPSWQRTQFNGEADEIGLKYEIDMIDEVIEATHAREFATKHKSTPRGDTLWWDSQQNSLLPLEAILSAEVINQGPCHPSRWYFVFGFSTNILASLLGDTLCWTSWQRSSSPAEVIFGALNLTMVVLWGSANKLRHMKSHGKEARPISGPRDWITSLAWGLDRSPDREVKHFTWGT